MNIEIKEFKIGVRGKKGWHLVLRNEIFGVSFTPNSGDLLIMLPRIPCSVCIPGDVVVCLEVVEKDWGFAVQVKYIGCKGQPNQYDSQLLLGISKSKDLLHRAREFVDSLNKEFYTKGQ